MALDTALQLYRIDHDQLPPDGDWFETLVREGFVDPETRNADPWGHPYVFYKTTTDFELLSIGGDGIAGTDDDQKKSNRWESRGCKRVERILDCGGY